MASNCYLPNGRSEPAAFAATPRPAPRPTEPDLTAHLNAAAFERWELQPIGCKPLHLACSWTGEGDAIWPLSWLAMAGASQVQNGNCH
jgi:hypothetical protein